MKRVLPLAIVATIAIAGALYSTTQSDAPASQKVPEQAAPVAVPDGLSQDNFDAVVRIRNSKGTGTGSIIHFDGKYYWIITNHHVAGGEGSINMIDIWNNGYLRLSVQAKVEESFFDANKSKDIALLKVARADLPGPMPVIKLAPYGVKLKVGDKIYQVGCDGGNWTNAECGRIVKIENGLIYYLPTSRAGNSGGPGYSATYQVGVTAWYTTINLNGKSTRVGLAMTSDRVQDIMAGRVVNGNFTLPPNTHPVALAQPQDLPWNRNTESTPQSKADDNLKNEWRQPGSRNDGRLLKLDDPKTEQQQEKDDTKQEEQKVKSEPANTLNQNHITQTLFWIALIFFAARTKKN